jgi:ABC-2 type transport system permease protein
MRGLFQLTWLEIKIFLREPLGAIGTLFVPVACFSSSAAHESRQRRPRTPGGLEFLQSGLPVMARCSWRSAP